MEANKINNIYCVARNYSEHAKELGNVIEDEPVIFLKPNSSINSSNEIVLHNFSENIHHEVELVIRIGKNISNKKEKLDLDVIDSYCIGIDLTARDIQSILKQKRLPWTLAKGFKGSAILTEFIKAPLPDINLLELSINEVRCQYDTTENLIYDIPYLLNYIDLHFGLAEGDLIYTGTPSGVGELKKGDNLTLKLNNIHTYKFKVL